MGSRIISGIFFILLIVSMLSQGFLVQDVQATDIIIDTGGDSRFTRYPSGPYWWWVHDHDAFRTRAYNGNFWYTYCGAEGTGEPLYFGTWYQSLSQSGVYEVFVWIPNPDPFGTYTPTQNARYQIYHKDGMTYRTVNQGLRTGGWYSVGTYTFDTSLYVILNDRTGEPYASTMIAFDAIKFTPVNPVLTVYSAHDSPNPSNGDHYYNDGSSVTCSVSSPVNEGGTVWTCTGWSGTGSVPASGSSTSVTFTITQDSSITWNWQGSVPQRRLTVYSAHDSPNPSNGDHYYNDGSSVTCSVTSPVVEGDVTYTCSGWSGTGSVPSSGTGNTVTFEITQDSRITWSWQGAPPSTYVKLDYNLLNLIDQYAGGYYKSAWSVTLDQYKAWIATIAWAEGGHGGCTAHSQGLLGGDVFNHKTKGSEFRFSTGIGPFQLDVHLQYSPTIDKLDPEKSLVDVLSWHNSNLGNGATLSVFAQKAGAQWLAVGPSFAGAHWEAVTGTEWDAHKNTKNPSLEWENVVNRVRVSDWAHSREANVKNVGRIKWSLTFTTDSGKHVSMNQFYSTFLISARKWDGTKLFEYYYTVDSSEGCEVWIWNDGRFIYGFARQYTTWRFPENRQANGIDAGFTLTAPALNMGSTPTKRWMLCSPGELAVYDSQSRVTGWVNGEIRQEIPFSVVDEQNEAITIFSPSDIYQCTVMGTDEGSYGLEISSVDEENTMTFIATDIPTSTHATHQFTVDWDALSQGEEGVTVMVDSDADGIFERTLTSDSKLRHNEFMGYVVDLNDDGIVNIIDIALVARAYGTQPGDENWNETADLNKDEIVNILDISIVAMDYGKTV